MYLKNGEWVGKQVVPEEWVRESTKVQYEFNKENQSGFENGYGFKWWINGETGYHMFSALGYGGQSINVIPELDLVVVMTSIPDRAFSIDDSQRMEIIKQNVISAIKN
jgi:CubicO group peptidase (beta-lactamase class C family)